MTSNDLKELIKLNYNYMGHNKSDLFKDHVNARLNKSLKS